MNTDLEINEDEELTVIEEIPENSINKNETNNEENIFSNSPALKTETTDPRIYSPRAYFSKQVALTRDRAAAFFLDLIVMIYLVIGLNPLFQKLLSSQTLLLKSKPFLKYSIEVGVIFLTVVFYYTLFESIFGATIGKIICRLRVINLNGKTASFSKNIIRNFLRIIDMPFFCLIALLSMESSNLNQRLGDRLAETIVIKKTRKRLTALHLKNIPFSKTFTRLIVFLIDLTIYFSFLWFYAANLNPQNKNSYLILFNLFPFFILCYFMIFDFLVSSSPGKILIGRKTVLETGEPLDGTSAILRNLLKPFDLLLGYPLLALTRKKQRLGDLVAESVVIKKSEKSGWIALGIILIIIGTLAFTSHKNPYKNWMIPKISHYKNNFLQKTFHFLKPTTVFNTEASKAIASPSTETEKSTNVQTNSTTLKITEFYFSAGADPSQIRSDGIFHRGDLIFTFFKLTGFQKDSSNKISLIEKISLKDPQEKLLLNQKEVVLLSQMLEKNSETILYANQIQLSENSPLGNYLLTLILRDEIAKTEFVYEKTFTLQ